MNVLQRKKLKSRSLIRVLQCQSYLDFKVLYVFIPLFTVIKRILSNPSSLEGLYSRRKYYWCLQKSFFLCPKYGRYSNIAIAMLKYFVHLFMASFLYCFPYMQCLLFLIPTNEIAIVVALFQLILPLKARKTDNH